MSEPEFSRTVRADTIGSAGRPIHLTATPAEREALAKRFGLVALNRLEAEVSLSRANDDVVAAGSLVAEAAQSCVVTGEPVPQRIEEEFEILFRPHPVAGGDEEIELDPRELDVVFHDGAMIDLGEAVAQSLALHLEPYPRAPGARAALDAAGVKDEGEAGPFGALAALKEKLGK